MPHYSGNFYKQTTRKHEKPQPVLYHHFPIPANADHNHRQYKVLQDFVYQEDKTAVVNFLKLKGYPKPVDTSKLPLQIAIENGNSEIVKILLQYTNVEEYFYHPKKDEGLEGYSPLFSALEKLPETRNREIVEILVGKIKNIPDTQLRLSFFMEKDINKNTCLLHALKNYSILNDERLLLFFEVMQAQALNMQEKSKLAHLNNLLSKEILQNDTASRVKFFKQRSLTDRKYLHYTTASYHFANNTEIASLLKEIYVETLDSFKDDKLTYLIRLLEKDLQQVAIQALRREKDFFQDQSDFQYQILNTATRKKCLLIIDFLRQEKQWNIFFPSTQAVTSPAQVLKDSAISTFCSNETETKSYSGVKANY